MLAVVRLPDAPLRATLPGWFAQGYARCAATGRCTAAVVRWCLHLDSPFPGSPDSFGRTRMPTNAEHRILTCNVNVLVATLRLRTLPGFVHLQRTPGLLPLRLPLLPCTTTPLVGIAGSTGWRTYSTRLILHAWPAPKKVVRFYCLIRHTLPPPCADHAGPGRTEFSSVTSPQPPLRFVYAALYRLISSLRCTAHTVHAQRLPWRHDVTYGFAYCAAHRCGWRGSNVHACGIPAGWLVRARTARRFTRFCIQPGSGSYARAFLALCRLAITQDCVGLRLVPLPDYDCRWCRLVVPAFMPG